MTEAGSHLSPTDETERARLSALQKYQILDTLPEPAFDRLTRLAAQICGTPLAIINLIDQERQWTKSASDGSQPEAIPRTESFCAHTIQHATVHVVPDTLADPRFVNNPFVTGQIGIRFYAGAPIRTSSGHNIGTICVIDMQPRSLTDCQVIALADLAAVVLDTLDLRLQLAERTAVEVERAVALQRAEASEIKYRTLFHVLPMGVSITDAAGQIVETNPAAEMLLHVSSDEHVRRGLNAEAWQIIHPDERPMTTEEFPAIRALRANTMVTDVDMGVVHGDGPTTWLTVSASPIPLADYGVVAVYHDITATRQAERALRESEARFAAAFRSSPVALSLTTVADGCILDANDRFLQLFQRSLSDVVGHTSTSLQMWGNLDDRPRIIQILKRDGFVRDWETRVRVAGTIRDVLVSVEPIQINGQ